MSANNVEIDFLFVEDTNKLLSKSYGDRKLMGKIIKRAYKSARELKDVLLETTITDV